MQFSKYYARILEKRCCSEAAMASPHIEKMPLVLWTALQLFRTDCSLFAEDFRSANQLTIDAEFALRKSGFTTVPAARARAFFSPIMRFYIVKRVGGDNNGARAVLTTLRSLASRIYVDEVQKVLGECAELIPGEFATKMGTGLWMEALDSSAATGIIAQGKALADERDRAPDVDLAGRKASASSLEFAGEALALGRFLFQNFDLYDEI